MQLAPQGKKPTMPKGFVRTSVPGFWTGLSPFQACESTNARDEGPPLRVEAKLCLSERSVLLALILI